MSAFGRFLPVGLLKSTRSDRLLSVGPEVQQECPSDVRALAYKRRSPSINTEPLPLAWSKLEKDQDWENHEPGHEKDDNSVN